jgi:hypothetical protein
MNVLKKGLFRFGLEITIEINNERVNADTFKNYLKKDFLAEAFFYESMIEKNNERKFGSVWISEQDYVFCSEEASKFCKKNFGKDFVVIKKIDDINGKTYENVDKHV